MRQECIKIKGIFIAHGRLVTKGDEKMIFKGKLII